MSVIKVSMGYTINAGNFESFRVDFGIEDETRPGETVKDATDRIYNYVEKTLVTKVAEARKDLA